MNKSKLLNILKTITSLIVILAMFVIIYYQNRDRDTFKSGKGESNNIISTNQNSLTGFSAGNLSKIGGNVALLTTTSYSIHKNNGTYKSSNIAFSQPVLHTEGSYAVCYELNSTQLYVFKNNSESYSVITENKIFQAKVNKNGYLFVATEKDGYNCECLVYNRSGDPIFKWDISKSEFIDGDINYNNDAIVLSLASSDGNELVGELLLINITNAKIIKRTTYNASMFFSVDFNDNGTYTALGNNSLKYFNYDGTEKWQYDYEGKKLLKADVSNHDMLVLAFSGSGEMYDGNSTEVVALSKLGKRTGKKTFDGSVDDLSVGSNCVAIAINKDIYIMNSKLSGKKTAKTNYRIKQIALFSDDTHVFVLGSSSGEILR